MSKQNDSLDFNHKYLKGKQPVCHYGLHWFGEVRGIFANTDWRKWDGQPHGSCSNASHIGPTLSISYGEDASDFIEPMEPMVTNWLLSFEILVIEI